MTVGTKSVLFGAHCFFLHPWFVAEAWRRLYGFPWDPRLWVAFFVHDLGYWGKPNMDGEEGERHVEFGACFMSAHYDSLFKLFYGHDTVWLDERQVYQPIGKWGQFCLFHSRFYAKKHKRPVSRLCIADKFALCLTPAWLYLPMVKSSGEIHEYMKLAEFGKYGTMNVPTGSGQLKWYQGVQKYLREWVAEHRDGKPDTWTPSR